MKSPITLGNLILEARKQKHLSQPSLSAAMGYPYNIVFTLENDTKKPSRADWERLKELLKGSLDLLAAESLLGDGLI